MPSKQFLLFLLIAVVVVAISVAGGLYFTRGSHVELKGTIQKVRTLSQADGSSLAVIDFRFGNPADYPFVVESVAVTFIDAQGQPHEGSTVADSDAKRIFGYYPSLGEKYNDSLVMKTKIPGHTTMDRMVAVRFEAPETALQGRKELKIHIDDQFGRKSDIFENPSRR